MSDDILSSLLGLPIGSDFTTKGIGLDIARNKQRHLYDDLSRDQFVEKVFFAPDLALLPPGHLTDHRIRMTERLADVFSTTPLKRIESLLRRMIMVAPHPEAYHLIATALEVDVPAIARALIGVRSKDPKIFRACISGDLGDACRAVYARTFPKSQRETVLACIADMLLLYAMVEVQLIAARARAIDGGRLGKSGPQPPMMASSIIDDLQSLMEASVYYQHRREHGRFPRQRPPLLANPKLMLRALQIFRASGRSVDDLHGDFLDSTPLTDNAVAEGLAALDLLDARKAEAKANRGTINIGLREHASTMVERSPSGIQLAFAVLRLVNLRDRRHKMILPTDSERKIAFRAWSNAKLPRRTHPDVEIILFVIRTVLLDDRMAGQAFDRGGAPTALMPQIETFRREGRTAGEDLVKSAREGWPATDIRKRIIVTAGMDMEAEDGVHRIDILPDYRLQLNAPSPPRNAQGTASKERHEPQTRQHVRYEIVGRSRRHPNGPRR